MVVALLEQPIAHYMQALWPELEASIGFLLLGLH